MADSLQASNISKAFGLASKALDQHSENVWQRQTEIDDQEKSDKKVANAKVLKDIQAARARTAKISGINDGTSLALQYQKALNDDPSLDPYAFYHEVETKALEKMEKDISDPSQIEYYNALRGEFSKLTYPTIQARATEQRNEASQKKQAASLTAFDNLVTTGTKVTDAAVEISSIIQDLPIEHRESFRDAIYTKSVSYLKDAGDDVGISSLKNIKTIDGQPIFSRQTLVELDNDKKSEAEARRNFAMKMGRIDTISTVDAILHGNGKDSQLLDTYLGLTRNKDLTDQDKAMLFSETNQAIEMAYQQTSNRLINSLSKDDYVDLAAQEEKVSKYTQDPKLRRLIMDGVRNAKTAELNMIAVDDNLMAKKAQKVYRATGKLPDDMDQSSRYQDATFKVFLAEAPSPDSAYDTMISEWKHFGPNSGYNMFVDMHIGTDHEIAVKRQAFISMLTLNDKDAALYNKYRKSFIGSLDQIVPLKNEKSESLYSPVSLINKIDQTYKSMGIKVIGAPMKKGGGN